MDIDVYEQYFAAKHPGNGTPRRAARAALLAGLRPVLEELAAGIGGEIFLDQPLTAARCG